MMAGISQLHGPINTPIPSIRFITVRKDNFANLKSICPVIHKSIGIQQTNRCYGDRGRGITIRAAIIYPVTRWLVKNTPSWGNRLDVSWRGNFPPHTIMIIIQCGVAWSCRAISAINWYGFSPDIVGHDALNYFCDGGLLSPHPGLAINNLHNCVFS